MASLSHPKVLSNSNGLSMAMSAVRNLTVDDEASNQMIALGVQKVVWGPHCVWGIFGAYVFGGSHFWCTCLWWSTFLVCMFLVVHVFGAYVVGGPHFRV